MFGSNSKLQSFVAVLSTCLGGVLRFRAKKNVPQKVMMIYAFFKMVFLHRFLYNIFFGGNPVSTPKHVLNTTTKLCNSELLPLTYLIQ